MAPRRDGVKPRHAVGAAGRDPRGRGGRARITRAARHVATVALAAALSACVVIGDEHKPIGTLLVPAPAGGPADEVMIVLPGIGADAQSMHARGIAAAVHAGWPEVDVLLTDATFAYYVHQVLVPRLHAEVVEPARKRYRKVWLAGASIGGMGALLYEREHPRYVAGLVLFAPWLGNGDTIDEIRDAGSVHQWDPGPEPDAVDSDNFDREAWRIVKSWTLRPDAPQRIWMVCGKDDRLAATVRLVAAALPPTHYLEVDGGHTWETWQISAAPIMAKVRDASRASEVARGAP